MDKRKNRTAKAGTPYQVFNGKRYYLYRNQPYFTAHEKRMHVAVWEYHNGKVPKGYHIHHKDENKHNNTIENLECIPGSEHMALHNSSPEAWLNTEAGRKHTAAIQPLTKAWHTSEAGLAWHKEHAANCNFGNFDYGTAGCMQCGNEYQKKTLRSKFCSSNCKTQNRKASGVDNVSRKCLECGTMFTINKYSKTVCCSKSCAASFRYN